MPDAVVYWHLRSAVDGPQTEHAANSHRPEVTNDIPVRIDAPGAVARQLSDFGEASGTMGAEYFSHVPVMDHIKAKMGLASA